MCAFFKSLGFASSGFIVSLGLGALGCWFGGSSSPLSLLHLGSERLQYPLIKEYTLN